ncbi:MAG: hypothetical protein QM766_15640 [Burkholderiaceae bacterium]
MKPRNADPELPPPLPVAPGMPERIGAKERTAVLVWIGIAAYFVYVLVF